MNERIESQDTLEQAAEKFMKSLSEMTKKKNLLKAKTEDEIEVAKNKILAKYNLQVAPIDDEIGKVEKSLQSLLRQYQEAFTLEGQKERECEFGWYGWRWGGDSTKIVSDADLQTFVAMDPVSRADCGTFKFMANKEGVKRRLQNGEDVPGCILSGKNRSFYTLKEEVKK